MTPETTAFAAVLVALLAVLIGTDAPGSFIAAILRLRSNKRQGTAVIRAWLAKLGVPQRDRQDLTQEVILEALKSWHAFDPNRQRQNQGGRDLFVGWLNRITVHVVTHYLRRANHRLEVPTPDPVPKATPDPTPLLPELLEVEERRQQLMARIDELDRELRVVLIAYDLEGLPMAEVARREGISKWKAYRLRARALVMLQAALGAKRNRGRRKSQKPASASRSGNRRRRSPA